MFCTKCGKQIMEESRFCRYCGAPVNAVFSRKESTNQFEAGFVEKIMVCHKCGGTYEVKDNGAMLKCPYCGSEKIYMESDALRIARYKAQSDNEVRLREKQIELEKRKMIVDALFHPTPLPPGQREKNINFSLIALIAMASFIILTMLMVLLLVIVLSNAEKESRIERNTGTIIVSYIDDEYIERCG